MNEVARLIRLLQMNELNHLTGILLLVYPENEGQRLARSKRCPRRKESESRRESSFLGLFFLSDYSYMLFYYSLCFESSASVVQEGELLGI